MEIVVRLIMQMTPLPMLLQTISLENLRNITQELSAWFANNQMKANHGKCHLLLSTLEDEYIQIVNATINCSRSQKLLGRLFD